MTTSSELTTNQCFGCSQTVLAQNQLCRVADRMLWMTGKIIYSSSYSDDKILDMQKEEVDKANYLYCVHTHKGLGFIKRAT